MAGARTVAVMCHGIVDTTSGWKGPLQSNVTLNYATDPRRGDQILCSGINDLPTICQNDRPRFRVVGNEMYYNLNLSFYPRSMPGVPMGVYMCDGRQLIDFESDADFAGLKAVGLDVMIDKILRYFADQFPFLENDDVPTTIWLLTCSNTHPSRMKMDPTWEGYVDPLYPDAEPLHGFTSDAAGIAAITEQRRVLQGKGKRRRKTAIRRKNGRRRTQKKRKTYVRS